MDKQQVLNRLAQLEAEQKQTLDNLMQVQATTTQLQANVNAYAGAIEDCKFWLLVIEKEAENGMKTDNSLPQDVAEG